MVAGTPECPWTHSSKWASRRLGESGNPVIGEEPILYQLVDGRQDHGHTLLLLLPISAGSLYQTLKYFSMPEK